MKYKQVLANIELIAKNKRIKKQALVDTGAVRSIITKKLADELGVFEPFDKILKLKSANIGGEVRIVGWSKVDVIFEGTEMPAGAMFLVSDNLIEEIEVVIGRTEIDAWDIIFTDERPRLGMDPKDWSII